MRDPIRLGFALAGSLLLMLVLGFGMTTDIENLRNAVFDQDQSPQSRQYLQELSRRTYGETPDLTLADLEVRYQYNPSFESINAMAPSVPAMLLILIPAILMAVSVAKEKELGSITNFYVTPTTQFEFLIGKQLPYVGMAMINFLLLTLMAI